MIPVNIPIFSGNEKKYLNECIDSGWISSEGPFIQKFENNMADYVGRKYGIAVANGSAALDIAVKAAGIRDGDEVIMPTFTIISPAQSVIYAGGVPVLVDADPITWCMDVSKIEEKITPKTKAIIVVHIYGFPTDMNTVIEIVEKYNLILIEDAAEMHGQMYKGKMCGGFGHLSIFSFYPNKHITTGEGGMILTNNLDLAEKCKYYRNLCFEAERRFVHKDLGWNYRMTNLQAALGVAQLEQIEKHIQRKREIGKLYNGYLSQCNKIELMPTETDFAQNIYWVFAIISKDKSAIECMKALAQVGIGTRPFFFPMHLQPVFIMRGLFKDEKYPVAERISEYGFYLPSGLGITNDEIAEVSEKLLKII